MRLLKLGLLLAVAAATLGFLGVLPAMADGPATPVLEPLPPAQPAEGQQSVILGARLHDGQGQVMAGQPVTFYVLTTVFGERLMKVGQVLTDATGVAAIAYTPSWEGDHTVVARLPGNGSGDAVQTLGEIGAVYGLTRERIRQVEAIALRKLARGPARRRLEGFVGA